jgi:hypothetical protein
MSPLLIMAEGRGQDWSVMTTIKSFPSSPLLGRNGPETARLLTWVQRLSRPACAKQVSPTKTGLAIMSGRIKAQLPPLASHGLRGLQAFHARRKDRKHEAELRVLALVPVVSILIASVQ